MRIRTLQLILLLAFALPADFICSPLHSAEEKTAVERGLYNLTHNAYGAPVMTDALFARLSNVWEPEWKAKIDANDPASARKVAFERYGFSEATWDNRGGPMQFVVTAQGAWVQTCML